jgi:hypothetical protein
MFRYELNDHDTYIWDPVTDRFTLQRTWNLYANDQTARHLLLRDLVKSWYQEKRDHQRWTLCRAFILKLALSFGTEAVGLESLEKTRLGEGPKNDIRSVLQEVFWRRAKVKSPRK